MKKFRLSLSYANIDSTDRVTHTHTHTQGIERRRRRREEPAPWLSLPPLEKRFLSSRSSFFPVLKLHLLHPLLFLPSH